MDNKHNDLWSDWILFKTLHNTNPSLQLKKQGATFQNDQYIDFTYRPNVRCPPSMQEFYESVLNGIIKRQHLRLYKGDFHYYKELQNCLHEFLKLLPFKIDILIEIFQVITGLNLTKEQKPCLVIPCSYCKTNVYIDYHCKTCFCAFYCDKTCMKNHKNAHSKECTLKMKITPSIIYPLQVELHCGGDLGEDIEIYFEHEKKLSLKYRGMKFMTNMIKVLNKNRWLRSNFFSILEEKERNKVTLKYHQVNDLDIQDKRELPLYDNAISKEEDLYLQMPVVQEMKVLFLNMGAILQDVVRETYEHYIHFVHIYYVPV